MEQNVAGKWPLPTVFATHRFAVQVARLLAHLQLDRRRGFANFPGDRVRLLSNLLVDEPRLFGH